MRKWYERLFFYYPFQPPDGGHNLHFVPQRMNCKNVSKLWLKTQNYVMLLMKLFSFSENLAKNKLKICLAGVHSISVLFILQTRVVMKLSIHLLIFCWFLLLVGEMEGFLARDWTEFGFFTGKKGKTSLGYIMFSRVITVRCTAHPNFHFNVHKKQ